MRKLEFTFNYWDALGKYMQHTYANVVFMYDSEVSFFDAEEQVLSSPKLFGFDTIAAFVKWYENGCDGESINIIDNLSVLWVNGIIDKKVIRDLRG
jgi:hypothetical protein